MIPGKTQAHFQQERCKDCFEVCNIDGQIISIFKYNFVTQFR